MRMKDPISQPKLGQKLCVIRIKKGLTQLELREKSHVSVRTIQRIESGSVTPRTVTIKILLDALGEKPEEWFESKSRTKNLFSTKNLRNMLLINPSESELKHAFNPAWISGIVYLLIVLMEPGLSTFSDYLDDANFFVFSMVFIKILASLSFFLFTRGILSLSLLFENHFLKVAAYVSMFFVIALYLAEATLIAYSPNNSEMADNLIAFAVIPLGVISIFLGIGFLRLQDGMGKIAKTVGTLEIIFGICYVSLILSFLGVLLLTPLLVIEVVLLFKADQLVKEGEL